MVSGSSPMYRWADIMDGNIDTRSADEIVDDVLSKSGIKVIE